MTSPVYDDNKHRNPAPERLEIQLRRYAAEVKKDILECLRLGETEAVFDLLTKVPYAVKWLDGKVCDKIVCSRAIPALAQALLSNDVELVGKMLNTFDFSKTGYMSPVLQKAIAISEIPLAHSFAIAPSLRWWEMPSEDGGVDLGPNFNDMIIGSDSDLAELTQS